jgi:Recombination endonuclease VII
MTRMTDAAEVKHPPNVLLSGINGSTAYGLATEDSDVDREEVSARAKPQAPGSTRRRPREPKRTWTCCAPECSKTFERVVCQVRDPSRVYCSPACVARHLSLIKFPQAARVEAARRYANGELARPLAEEYGVTPSTFRKALLELGVKLDRSRSGYASWVSRRQAAPDEGDLETGYRWCIDCRERKPMIDFYWRSKAKKSRTLRCKSCFGIHLRTTYKANIKGHKRKAAYGITPAQFDQMWQEQRGRCAICRDPLDDSRRNGVHVDHCHFDDQVRGLLCGKCNVGLGHFRDDPELLLEAARYLMAEHWHPALESLVVPHDEIPDYVDRWGAP